MPTHRPLTHWLLLFALVIMWGSSFMFTKIAVAAIAPTNVVAGRLVLAAVVLLGVVVLSRRWLPTDGRSWRFFIAMALVGNCLPFWLITWGQQRIDSGLAGILMAIMPLATVLLAHVFVAGERMNRTKAAGFLAGFVGIVVLMGPAALLELRGSGAALFSELAVLCGAICYAVNTIIARHRPDGHALVAGAGVILVASLVMAPTAALTDGFVFADIAPLPAAAVGFLGIVSTALATVVYFKLVAIAGPSFLSLINYLIPVWAVMIGMVFLGESPEWSSLAALALILSGIALSEAGSRHRAPPRG